jgi:heme exporter protein A
MYRLTVTDLAKRFGPRKVFSDISFELETGNSIAVVGPNGSGKTTLIMTLLRNYHPTRGSVTFSEDGDVLDENRLRTETALVAPYLNLYDRLSAEENMVFFATVCGAEVTGKQINRLLQRVGLEGRGPDLVGSYSSGMKQRLKYAVALLLEPSFLFLDEPTSNLDEDGKRIVFEIIEEYRNAKVIVIATNEPEEQQLAAKVCRVAG